MSQPNYQTVKLARGRHSSPQDGVCVMELASMLASEPFSDRPRCVSPAIGGFLRSYNDLVDDRRRQDLYGCAAEVIDTAGPPEVEAARAARLRAWGEDRRAHRWWRRLMPRRLRTRAESTSLRPHQAGPFAIHSIGRVTDEVHASVLALIAELIAIGQGYPAASSRPARTSSGSPFGSSSPWERRARRTTEIEPFVS